jgi:hypothetical protein
MDAPPSSPAVPAEKSLSSDGEAEISRSVEQRILKSGTYIGAEAERIRASVMRLTSNSIDGLEGLSFELQQLQTFIKSEVERVQGDIEIALAGIKIIIETIAPWKKQGGAFRAGPAASIESAQLRR